MKAGDHVVSCDDVYGGTHRLFTKIMSKFGIDFTFIRMDYRKKLEDAIRPNTKMVWVETPSNPLLNITDLEMVTGVAKPRGILTVVDNTFSSPYFLRPIDFGAVIVVHSTTKYLNGHCDVVGGAVVTTTDRLAEEAKRSAGIDGDVIRLSIGLEDAEDIVEDLDKGLKASKSL